MAVQFFHSTFRNANVPVIVFRNAPEYPLVLVNVVAQIMLAPHLTISSLDSRERELGRLADVLRFSAAQTFGDLMEAISSTGNISNYRTILLDFEKREVPVSISANLVAMEDGDFIVLYINEEKQRDFGESDMPDIMQYVFQTAYHSENMDDAIDKILRATGGYVHVSRAYIFEEISPEMTCNTYEWCAEGVEPAIQDLQNLRKEDYNYDAIVRGGVYITDDIRELPHMDFRILVAQGIKSLAIIPLYHIHRPLGYVGFDDCEQYRKWSSFEIETLQSIANIIASLLVRRNAEKKAARSQRILQTISDNIDSVIYVNDMDTCELVFVNKALRDSLGIADDEDLRGKRCWQVLQKDRDGPCDFCPMKKLRDENRNVLRDSYSWEFQNTLNDKWYMVKDSVIEWVDGRKVHIEAATEITHQKQYEQRLEYFASTDTMTGVYNREWGNKLMQEILSTPQYHHETLSLVFLDLDGLKLTNDTYGHDAGDDMIVRMVSTIRQATRKSDLIFRWGGDEFILLLECDTGAAARIMKGIQEKLDEFNATGEKPYRLGFSFGITAFAAGEGVTVDSLVTIADRKMYENKMSKRMTF